jgi:hypothetical protein
MPLRALLCALRVRGFGPRIRTQREMFPPVEPMKYYGKDCTVNDPLLTIDHLPAGRQVHHSPSPAIFFKVP